MFISLTLEHQVSSPVEEEVKDVERLLDFGVVDHTRLLQQVLDHLRTSDGPFLVELDADELAET